MVEFDPADFNFLVKMWTGPIRVSGAGVFTVEDCKSGKPKALDLHLKYCIACRAKFELHDYRRDCRKTLN